MGRPGAAPTAFNPSIGDLLSAIDPAWIQAATLVVLAYITYQYAKAAKSQVAAVTAQTEQIRDLEAKRRSRRRAALATLALVEVIVAKLVHIQQKQRLVEPWALETQSIDSCLQNAPDFEPDVVLMLTRFRANVRACQEAIRRYNESPNEARKNRVIELAKVATDQFGNLGGRLQNMGGTIEGLEGKDFQIT
jgi:hypothetical protein